MNTYIRNLFKHTVTSPLVDECIKCFLNEIEGSSISVDISYQLFLHKHCAVSLYDPILSYDTNKILIDIDYIKSMPTETFVKDDIFYSDLFAFLYHSNTSKSIITITEVDHLLHLLSHLIDSVFKYPGVLLKPSYLMRIASIISIGIDYWQSTIIPLILNKSCIILHSACLYFGIRKLLSNMYQIIQIVKSNDFLEHVFLNKLLLPFIKKEYNTKFIIDESVLNHIILTFKSSNQQDRLVSLLTLQFIVSFSCNICVSKQSTNYFETIGDIIDESALYTLYTYIFKSEMDILSNTNDDSILCVLFQSIIDQTLTNGSFILQYKQSLWSLCYSKITHYIDKLQSGVTSSQLDYKLVYLSLFIMKLYTMNSNDETVLKQYSSLLSELINYVKNTELEPLIDLSNKTLGMFNKYHIESPIDILKSQLAKPSSPVKNVYICLRED